MNKDLKVLLKKAREQGFTVRMNRRQHYRVTSPSGETISTPSTPSDYRSLREVRSKLRRIGMDV